MLLMYKLLIGKDIRNFLKTHTIKYINKNSGSQSFYSHTEKIRVISLETPANMFFSVNLQAENLQVYKKSILHMCLPRNFAEYFKNGDLPLPILSHVLFIYPLKTSENLKFFDVFRGWSIGLKLVKDF